jgi:repressor LexA
VLDFIAGFIARHGYSPSFEEIAEGVGLASIATVHKHLTALDTKGYLKRNFNQSRSLDLAPKFYREMRQHQKAVPAAPEAPLLGTIAAGQPIETFSTPESLSFADFTGSKDVYALEVRGDSMIDDHIMEGDYVLVEKTDRVHNGDIVVALVDGSESTLKRFYREKGDRARLQPANAAMEPIFVSLADLEIQGRVLAVHRKYR